MLEITDHDLEQLGFKLGMRKKIIKIIAEIQQPCCSKTLTQNEPAIQPMNESILFDGEIFQFYENKENAPNNSIDTDNSEFTYHETNNINPNDDSLTFNKNDTAPINQSSDNIQRTVFQDQPYSVVSSFVTFLFWFLFIFFLFMQVFNVAHIVENCSEPEIPHLITKFQKSQDYIPTNREILLINRIVVQDLVIKCG